MVPGVGANARMTGMKPLRTAILAALVILLPVTSRPAEHPLSADDVTLLLIGGATADRLVTMIDQRGVDFQLTAELEKKFRDQGATDSVIDALKKAGEKLAPPAGNRGTVVAQSGVSPPSTASTALPVVKTPAGGGPASPGAGTAATPDLPDPSPEKNQQIIQAFAAKEALFKQARDNYTFHQTNKVEELDPDGNVMGTYQQDWDILYDDGGKRIEQVTYAPPDSLKGLLITKEDLERWRSIQPFVLTSDKLPEYEVKYMGHVKVDEITAYVFSVRPKAIRKGEQYFQGVVWVDDQDLQVVKAVADEIMP